MSRRSLNRLPQLRLGKKRQLVRSTTDAKMYAPIYRQHLIDVNMIDVLLENREIQYYMLCTPRLEERNEGENDMIQRPLIVLTKEETGPSSEAVGTSSCEL